MANTEQEGAPSATAGGASAPDLDRVHRLAAEWGWMAGKAMARFVNSISGPIDGRLTDVAARDPRDAEIERLRGELAKANSGWETWRDEQRARSKQQDNELRVVAQRLHELIGDTEPCAMAFISTRHLHGLLDRVAVEPSPEIERLKLEVASARSIADEKRAVAEKLRGQVDDLSAERDDLAERLEAVRPAREAFRKQLNETDRLRGELCQIRDIALVVLNVLPDDDDRSAVDLVREILETVGPEKLRRDNQFSALVAERDRKRRELADVTAERDRLRQELDLIHEKHAAGLVTLRTDFTAAVNGLLPRPAEPRRWVAGDPEPEIGVTVRRISVADYDQRWTRMPNGSWHPNHACQHGPADQCSGLVFAEWKQLPRPLVEVVNSDG